MKLVKGQIKEASGLRRYLLQGLEKTYAEEHSIAATCKLLKASQQQGLVAVALAGWAERGPGWPEQQADRRKSERLRHLAPLMTTKAVLMPWRGYEQNS